MNSESTHASQDPAAPAVPDHTLLRVIGQGSYGEVWLARNVMGSLRAVKVVKRLSFDSERPFVRELEGIQRYEPVSRTHSGLVQVLHVGRDAENAYFYYVMELADDGALTPDEEYTPKTLRRELQYRRALPVTECVEIGMTLASALGHLHQAALVHRDVKPANIIFAQGVPKLADVGLVAGLGDGRSLVGTEGYFAPEGTGQARSDVYSLGKVLYECVTGLDRLNFPDVPDWWSMGSSSRAEFEFMEIVLKAAESNPERRYADTDEMLADLALLKAGKSLRQLRRMETRLRRTLQVLAVAAIGLALIAGGWAYERQRVKRVTKAEQIASQSQAETQRLLGESLIAEARALRQGHQAGARQTALEAIEKARDLGAPTVSLRSEAASALGLADIGAFEEWKSLGEGRQLALSPDGQFYAVMHSQRVRLLNRDQNAETVIPTPWKAELVSISPGGKFILPVSKTCDVALIEAATGEVLWSDHIGFGHVASFSADGSWVIYSADAGMVARSTLKDSEPIVIGPSAPTMRHVILAPNGEWAVALPLPDPRPDEKVPAEEASSGRRLGAYVYTGFANRAPTPADIAKIKCDYIDSDIMLLGPSVSADSRYFAAAVGEDRLRVWEMPSRQQIAWLRGHQRSVQATAFHPQNSSLVASSSWDGTTRLWDVPTRQELLVTHHGGVDLVLRPEQGEMVHLDWDRQRLRSAPLAARQALKVLPLPSLTKLGLFSGLDYSKDGRWLAAAGDAGVIVWDLRTGHPTVVHPSTVNPLWGHVVFHPNCSQLYASSRTGVVASAISLDAKQNLVVGPPQQLRDGFSGSMVWIGERLAVGWRISPTKKHSLELFDPLKPTEPSIFLEPGFGQDLITVSPDKSWLCGAGYKNQAALWDLNNLQQPPQILSVSGRLAPLLLNDGLLFCGEQEISLRQLVRPTDSSQHLMKKNLPAPLTRRLAELIPGRSALSPDGTLVALSTGPTEVSLCHANTFEPILALESPLTPFDCSLCFSDDGTTLALAGGVSRLITWDIAWLKRRLEVMKLGW